MTTINTTNDFIRALRENQDFHAAARRELLTEELLELLQRFNRYALETDKRLDALTEAVAALTERVDALVERAEATDRRFEMMIRRMDM